MKEYITIKIEAHDHKVMKDVKKLTDVALSRQIHAFLKEKYPNMYKENK